MKKFILTCLIIIVYINAVFSQVLRVAIIDFENTSGISKYDGLGKAMSSMLISDIEANVSPKRLQLVERSQINKILKEQNFQSSSAVDKASAVQIGKILGVKYLLVGDIYILNDILVINARLTDTETGDIKFSKKQEGTIMQWLTLKTNIAKELASNISMPFTEPNIPDKEINSAVITTYGNALTAKDEGNIDKAEQLINTVQDFNPEFKYAEEIKIQLEELKKQVKQNTEDVKSLKKSVSTIEFSIKRIEESNSDPIGNPATAYDYLTNALLFKKSGDNIKAVSNFKKYFDFNLSFYEPQMEFQELLSIMNSNSENESYLNYIKKHQDAFHKFIYIIFSYTGESLLQEIEKFNAANPSFQLSELFRVKLIIKLDQSSSSLNPNSMDFCQIAEKYRKSSQNLDKIKAAVTYDQYFIDKALAKDYITQNEINYINSWSTFLFNLIEGLSNQGVTSEGQMIDFVKKMGGCSYCPDSTIAKTLKLVNMKKQKIAGSQIKKFNKIEGKFNLLINGAMNNENYILIENDKLYQHIQSIGNVIEMNIKQDEEQLIASVEDLKMVYKIIDESTLEYKEPSIDYIYKKSKNKSEINSEDRGGGSEDGFYILVKNGVKDQNDLLTIRNGTMVFNGKNHPHEIKMVYKKDNSLLEATIGKNFILFQVIDKNKIIEFDMDKKKEDLLIYERVK